MLTIRLKKLIKSLHLKKFQQKYNKFIVETPKVIDELLNNGNYDVEMVFAVKEWLNSNQHFVDSLGAKVVEINQKELEQISNLKTANQVLAVVYKKEERTPEITKGDWMIYLDDLQDPGNVGTILRTAEWFGIKSVFASHQSVDFYNNKLIKSSMGSFFRLELSRVDLVAFAQLNKVPIYSLHMEGDNLFELENPEPGIIVIGNEGQGVSEAILKASTAIWSIPGGTQTESLNAAIACGIALSHICK